ncbi:MAG TPA: putative molybdenum carrier protein [Caldisericia bacterium]|nr:putative molybdenum carrier protein [Caldisericia bacterium]HRV74117.1 putative molybdenum carrier protein [Caldisericia bacterium]
MDIKELTIVSGGQTGVDRAALDCAIELGIKHGGYCPFGRLCEDGEISEKYNLTELKTSDYAKRTIMNVSESCATLILVADELTGGTRLTLETAARMGRPVLLVKLPKRSAPKTVERVCGWIEKNNPKRLNVAGPRASSNPEIYNLAKTFLFKVLETLSNDNGQQLF